MRAKRRLNEADIEVAKRVRLRRMELRISQTELGDALGITFQQVQKYEKGTNRITAGRLHKIADVLRVPVTFFFGTIPGISKDNEPILTFLGTAYSLRLLKAFSKIDKSLQHSVLTLIEELAAKS